jgi:hypothetical protein
LKGTSGEGIGDKCTEQGGWCKVPYIYVWK